jgi:hypothetical protein
MLELGFSARPVRRAKARAPRRASPAPREPSASAGAVAPHAGSPEPLHRVLQQGDRQVGLVQDPRGGSYSPQRGLFNGRAGDLAQGQEELVPAADRVGAGPFQSLCGPVLARGPWPAGGGP